MAAISGPNLISDSLKLNVDFSTNRSFISGTVFKDIVNKINGDIYNGGIASNILSTDGTNDYAIIPLSASAFKNNLTVEFAIYNYAGGSLFQWAGSLSAGVPFILFRNSSGDTGYQLYVNGNYRITTTVEKYNWTTVSITYNGSTWILYINGVQIGTYVGSNLYWDYGSSLYLGNGYNSYFNGSFQNIRVYDRALSSNEIKKNYLIFNERSYPIISNGLMLHIDPLNKSSYVNGASVAYDLSPSGLNMNITYSAGNLEKSSDYNFEYVTNNQNMYIYRDNPSNIPRDPFTVDCWVNMTSRSPTSYGISILQNLQDCVNGSRWGCIYDRTYDNEGTEKFRLYCENQVYTSSIVSLNQWYHLCISRSGSNGKVYINGGKVSDLTNISNLNVTTPAFSYGCTRSCNALYGKGKYGPLKIYNRQLSDDEVRQNFQSIKGRYGF